MKRPFAGKWEQWGLSYMRKRIHDRCQRGHYVYYYIHKAHYGDDGINIIALTKECDICSETTEKWIIYDEDPCYKKGLKILDRLVDN